MVKINMTFLYYSVKIELLGRISIAELNIIFFLDKFGINIIPLAISCFILIVGLYYFVYQFTQKRRCYQSLSTSWKMFLYVSISLVALGDFDNAL